MKGDKVEKENAVDRASLAGIDGYLDRKYQQGEIRKELYEGAKARVIPNIISWMKDENINRISPTLREAIKKSVEEERWEDIVYAYLDDIAFGTGGIRGIAAFTERELRELAAGGIGAGILKGPNTINDIVLLLKSAGVANYATAKGLKSVVIGYDSRIQGEAFARLIAKTFLARGLTVYLFDEACPFPELTFAVPFLKADIGILISASHNDKRYNGYKLTANTGAGLGIFERNYLYDNFIKSAATDEIKLREFDKAEKEALVFLGGKGPLKDRNYYGRKLIDIHSAHINHIKKFLDISLLKEFASRVRVGYSAYHGAGRKAVPRLLGELGFTHTLIIKSLDRLDGMFPCFSLEQQPDPGDPVAAEIAVSEFKKEYRGADFENLDILVGTDPDADRVGLVIKIPEEQQEAYKEILKRPAHIKVSVSQERTDFSWMLIDADTAWTLLLWYQIEKEKRENNGELLFPEKKFIVLNHTTTDALVSLALKHGIGVVKTWVGFAMLSSVVDMSWQGKDLTEELAKWKESQTSKSHPVLYNVIDMKGKPRNVNIGAFEQSNGFSILGGSPLPGERLGENGHVRDKDGTFAAILLAELAAYAKARGTTIFKLIDENIYLDRDVGCFVTYYEPVPYWGQYSGPTGISKKIAVLKNLEDVRRSVEDGRTVLIGGKQIKSVEAYRTGKYDELHRWQGFPDEGIRFFFDERKVNHLTVRPSGTSQCLRFHVQLKVEGPTKQNLVGKKVEAHNLARTMIEEIRKMLGVEE